MDKSLLLRKLAELETYHDQLREYAALTVHAYSADWKIQRIVERTLQMMCETSADIANHLIAAKKLPPPTSYAHTFEILSDAGVISAELGVTMSRIARFRNILVHQYTSIDHNVVIDILGHHLGDFLKFRDAVVVVLR